MNEKKLEKLLETPEVQNVELDSKIKKSIDRNIRQKMLKTAIITLVFLLIGGLLTSKGLYAIEYNPLDENDFIIKSDKDDGTDRSTAGFSVLLETYLNMVMPGYIVGFGYPNYEKTGFGGYELTSGLHNYFDGVISSYDIKMDLKIQWSKMSIELDDYAPLTNYIGEYHYAGSGDPNEDVNLITTGAYDEGFDYVYEELKLLPDSAVLDVAISFKRPYSIEETYAFLAKYPSANAIWLPIAHLDGGEYGRTYGDFAGVCVVGSGGIEAVDLEKYPDFYARLGNDSSPQKIENMYLSQLKLLLDHPEFTNMISKSLGKFYPDYVTLKERYEMVKENGLQPIGARIHVRKGDLMKMIEQDELLYITMHNVKLSTFSRLNQR